MRTTASFIVLTALYLSSTSFSCSNSTFDLVWQAYSNCARPCLACECADYIDSFTNNCDYENGGCYKSQYHDTILATWACVMSHCGPTLAQSSFDTFASFCETKGTPLLETDVPPGYNGTAACGSCGDSMTDGGSPASRDTTPSTTGLSSVGISGTVIGAVGGVATILGTIIAYSIWKKKKAKTSPARHEGTPDALPLICRPQETPRVGAPSLTNFLRGATNGSATWTRTNTYIRLGLIERETTTEGIHVVGNGATGNTPATGRIVEEARLPGRGVAQP